MNNLVRLITSFVLLIFLIGIGENAYTYVMAGGLRGSIISNAVVLAAHGAAIALIVYLAKSIWSKK